MAGAGIAGIAAVALALAVGGHSGSTGSALGGDSIEFIYGLRPGIQPVTPRTREETVEIIRERLRRFGIRNVHVTSSSRTRLTVSGHLNRRKQHLIGDARSPAQLYFYDWEPNLIGREHAIGGYPGQQPPQGPLKAAEREWEEAGRNPKRPENAQLIYAGAMPTEYAAVRLASEQPAVSYPLGTIVVSELPSDSNGRVLKEAKPGWYALKDNPALSGTEITRPKQETNQLGQPNVTFDFTEKGRQAFHEVTRRIAERGQARAIGPVSEQAAEPLSGHFAVIIDSEIKTRPIINFAENPDGIDGYAGAEISGGFDSAAEAKQLASMLRTGPLPLEVVPIQFHPSIH